MHRKGMACLESSDEQEMMFFFPAPGIKQATSKSPLEEQLTDTLHGHDMGG